jgi:hypothetical protein
MVHKSATGVVGSSAIVLIADAWDDVEAVEQAIKDIRDEDIHLYIIGTGVPEDIVEKLTEEFADDEGFRIFHVDSEAEMAQAYYLIGNIEESETFAINERFETNVRWLVALVLTILSVFIIWALEVPLLRSRTHSV